MVVFHSYVSLPEGTYLIFWRLNMDQETVATKKTPGLRKISPEAMAHKKFDDLPLI